MTRNRIKAAGKRIGAAAARIGDLNKDGKVDKSDVKIAAGKGKTIASKAAKSAAPVAKEIAKNDMAKDAAAGAAIGALVAMPVPLIGPAVGAAVGAVAGVYKNISGGRRSGTKRTRKSPKSAT